MDCDSLRPQYQPTINFLLRQMEHLNRSEITVFCSQLWRVYHLSVSVADHFCVCKMAAVNVCVVSSSLSLLTDQGRGTGVDRGTPTGE